MKGGDNFSPIRWLWKPRIQNPSNWGGLFSLHVILLKSFIALWMVGKLQHEPAAAHLYIFKGLPHFIVQSKFLDDLAHSLNSDVLISYGG